MRSFTNSCAEPEKGTKVEARIRVPLVDIDRVVIVGRPNVTIAV